jgi:hypothetical protein
MTFAIVLLYLIVVVSLPLLGTLFYFQDKRQQALLDEISKLQEDMKLVQQNCLTLRQNDDTLAEDLKMLLHEFKDAEKKIKRNS